MELNSNTYWYARARAIVGYGLLAERTLPLTTDNVERVLPNPPIEAVDLEIHEMAQVVRRPLVDEDTCRGRGRPPGSKMKWYRVMAQRRASLGITQEECRSKIGIVPSKISEMENGKISSIRDLRKYLAFLGYDETEIGNIARLIRRQKDQKERSNSCD